MRRIATPNATSVRLLQGIIEDLIAAEAEPILPSATPNRILKTLVVMVDKRPFVVVLAGDRSADFAAIASIIGGKKCRLADPNTVLRITGAPVGWAGPVALADTEVPIVVDSGIDSSGYWAGANRDGWHYCDVILGRDFTPTHVGRVALPTIDAGNA